MSRANDLTVFRSNRENLLFWSLCAFFGLLMVMRYQHRGYFIPDDWTMLGSRMDHLEQLGLDDFILRRHNEHLMGGMVLWNFGLAKIFGLRDYLPWIISLQFANCFVSWVTYQYLKRLRVSVVVAAVIAPFLMIWAPFNQISFSAPHAIFTIALALVMTHFALAVLLPPSGRRAFLGAGLACLGIFINSVCVAIAPVTVIALMLQKRWRSAVVASVPMSMYLIWHVTYQKLPSSNRWATISGQEFVQTRDIHLFFTFTWKILSRTIWPDTSPLAAMIFVILVTIGLSICIRRGGEQRLVSICAVAASAIYIFGFTWSRGYVLEKIFQFQPYSRYAAVVAILLFPLAILPITICARHLVLFTKFPRSASIVVATILVVTVTIFNVHQRNGSDPGHIKFKKSGIEILKLANDPRLSTYPQSEFVFGDRWQFDLTYSDIVRFKRIGWL